MTFDRPPLNEVVLSLQSESVPGLTTPFLGLFWNLIRSRYPKTQVLPALDPVIERFDPTPKAQPTQSFRLLESVETPRCWFLTEIGQHLIQLQQDRLLLNWRRTDPKDVYPRYESLRREFESVAKELLQFLEHDQLGTLRPNQCELSYINHIEVGTSSARGELSRVLSFWGTTAVGGLPDAEDATAFLRFVIERDGRRLGRLHVAVKSAIRRTDEKPVLVLELTARGQPVTADLDGVLGFMDLGREWIHRAFRSLTSQEAQRDLWGGRDE